jgi:5-methylcytosine-specific restriction endonuclease McrA
MGKLRSAPPMLSSAPPRVRVAAKRADPLYTSPEWRKLVARLKRERGPGCSRCGSQHRVAGDHVVEVKDGGATLDPGNVQLLCHACHQVKTARAKRERVGLA